MTISFRYPSNLLHSLVEPQWLPRPRDERESSLDILERDEEAHMESVRQIVLPRVGVPEPIGIAGGTEEMKQQYGASCSSSTQDDLILSSLLVPPPPAIRFWDQYKSKVNITTKSKSASKQQGSGRTNELVTKSTVQKRGGQRAKHHDDTHEKQVEESNVDDRWKSTFDKRSVTKKVRSQQAEADVRHSAASRANGTQDDNEFDDGCMVVDNEQQEGYDKEDDDNMMQPSVGTEESFTSNLPSQHHQQQQPQLPYHRPYYYSTSNDPISLTNPRIVTNLLFSPVSLSSATSSRPSHPDDSHDVRITNHAHAATTITTPNSNDDSSTASSMLFSPPSTSHYNNHPGRGSLSSTNSTSYYLSDSSPTSRTG